MSDQWKGGWQAFLVSPGEPGQGRGCPSSERFHHHPKSGWNWGMSGTGGPGGFGPWSRGPRARRGDIRVSILALLAEKPMHGYQIIQELSDRSGGVWRPSPGSVYPTLQLLEDEGLISGAEVEGRRVYSLTEAGQAVLAERGEGAKMPWDEVAAGMGESTQALREAAMQVAAAVWQVGTSGTTEQSRKVVAILEETRKRIYGVLAEGE